MAIVPSIFNDVLGPVMRGPSSSHCAGALRIGRVCRDLMDGEISHASVLFDPDGSLATTHESQGSDMGLMGGLLGWEATDRRLPEAKSHLGKNSIRVEFTIRDIGAVHPNTYQLILNNPSGTCQVTALSVGGGMIEIIDIDRAKISLAGDYFETLVYCQDPDLILQQIKERVDHDDISVHPGPDTIIEVKSQKFPDQAVLTDLLAMKEVRLIRKIRPVLPVLSRKSMELPFLSSQKMLEFNRDRGLALWELALLYESLRGGIPEEEVYEKMRQLAGYMEDAISSGLNGTEYNDRILGSQSPAFKTKMDQNQLLGGNLTNRIIMSVSAVMEVKSAMGLIVAAPTAGSCGTIPGAVLGIASGMGLSQDHVIKALLSTGMIGIFIARHATFAAESGGCQAECGAASGMAAAGLVSLAGGSVEQSLAASSLALQNSLGMICDPIANRVEAPCWAKILWLP